MAKSKPKEIQYYYRVRNTATGEMYGSSTNSLFTKKGPCQKLCDRLNNSMQHPVAQLYVVIVYELREVNRKLKLEKFLNNQEPENE